MAFRLSSTSLARVTTRVMQLGDPGSGAGRSGGGGGSIREAGGAFGKLEYAREAEYFHNLQRQQLDELKATINKELEHTELQLKHHAETLARHKKRLEELEELQNKSE